MKERLGILITLAALTVIQVSATAAERQPLWTPGDRQQTSITVLQAYKIEGSGSHIQEGECMVFVGPVGASGDYLILPVSCTGKRKPRSAWRSIPYFAQAFGGASGFILPNVRVYSKDQHNPESSHVMTMRITEKDRDGGLKEIEIATVGGDVHNGRAHFH